MERFQIYPLELEVHTKNLRALTREFISKHSIQTVKISKLRHSLTHVCSSTLFTFLTKLISWMFDSSPRSQKKMGVPSIPMFTSDHPTPPFWKNKILLTNLLFCCSFCLLYPERYSFWRDVIDKNAVQAPNHSISLFLSHYIYPIHLFTLLRNEFLSSLTNLLHPVLMLTLNQWLCFQSNENIWGLRRVHVLCFLPILMDKLIRMHFSISEN